MDMISGTADPIFIKPSGLGAPNIGDSNKLLNIENRSAVASVVKKNEKNEIDKKCQVNEKLTS
jgi:hypothetical protein